MINHFYKEIQGWFKYDQLYKAAVEQAKQNSVFVEVGSWKGRSAAFMATEIANSGKKIKFYCVDTWLGSDEAAHHNDPAILTGTLYEEFLNNTKRVEKYIETIRKTSVQASSLFEDESIDFLMLDAAHDYDSVITDLVHWYPKIKPNGIISGDDWNWPGVKRACREFFIDKRMDPKRIDIYLPDTKGTYWSVLK